MTSKEAYRLIASSVKHMKIVKCVEYSESFVFHLSPKNYKGDGSKLMDNMRSVNKKTKEIRDFKPFHISGEDYKTGKRVNVM